MEVGGRSSYVVSRFEAVWREGKISPPSSTVGAAAAERVKRKELALGSIESECVETLPAITLVGYYLQVHATDGGKA